MLSFPNSKNLVDNVKNMKITTLKISDFAVLLCFSRRHYLLKTMKSHLRFLDTVLGIGIDSEIQAWEREL